VAQAFGDAVSVPPNAEAADWLQPTRLGAWGTVGCLVPNQYESYLRVAGAPSKVVDWWDAQRQLIADVARVAASHTTTPERCWFGIWEGHGFDRNGEVRARLRQIPTVDLPHRSYYLLQGDVLAASAIEEPGGRGATASYRQPDLWWPHDRAWFIATDVDFWSTFIGGDARLVQAIVAAVQTPTELVSLEDRLPDEP
jgi:hypothetical protein